MKTPEEIREKINLAKDKLVENQDNYSKLNQMDMQGQEGSIIKEYIHKLMGTITALEWVVEE